MGGRVSYPRSEGCERTRQFVSECDGLKTSRDASDKEPLHEFSKDTGLERPGKMDLRHSPSFQPHPFVRGKECGCWTMSRDLLVLVRRVPRASPVASPVASLSLRRRLRATNLLPPPLTSPRSCSPCCRACSRWPGVGAAWPPRPPRATRAPFRRRRRSSRGGCSTLGRRRRAARRRRASP